MKIGYFCAKYPYSNNSSFIDLKEYLCGGSILAAYYLAKHISNFGIDLEVFTSSIDINDAIEYDKKIIIRRFGTNYRVLTSNISFGLFYRPIIDDLDLIHIHYDIWPSPYAGFLSAIKGKKPYILTYHGDWPDNYGSFLRKSILNFNNKYIVKKLLSSASIIISPSDSYIKNSNILSKYAEKIRTIPNGINIDEFDIPYTKEQCRRIKGLPTDDPIILFCGNLSPHKSPDILLKSIAKVKSFYPNIWLILMGTGIMINDLKSLARKLGIEKQVIFTGHICDINKYIYFKLSDIFCLPSIMETFGIVNLEAMASNLPIIASDVGGVRDIIINGYNGILVPPGDELKLANEIIMLLDNNEIARNMGRNGRAIVERRYTWEKVSIETLKLYNEIIT